MQGNPHVRFYERDVETELVDEPLRRYRQTKGAETDMPGLPLNAPHPDSTHCGRSSEAGRDVEAASPRM